MNVTTGPLTWLGRFWVATSGEAVVEVSFGRCLIEDGGPPDPLGREAARQLREFLEADRRAFDLPLDWSVMPRVHAEILRCLYEQIPWGQVIAYGELAALAGYPGAARAAGTACRHNPFSVVVPAHRVIAAGGRLGGYLGREDLKRKLLEREGVFGLRD